MQLRLPVTVPLPTPADTEPIANSFLEIQLAVRVSARPARTVASRPPSLVRSNTAAARPFRAPSDRSSLGLAAPCDSRPAAAAAPDSRSAALGSYVPP